MQIPSYEQDVRGQNWRGGPSHHEQRQHIPHYSGHLHGMVSENMFGKPYAKISADVLNNKVDRGFIIDEKARFQSTYGNSYINDAKDRSRETLTKAADAAIGGMKQKLDDFNKTKTNPPPELAAIDRLPVVGYQGYRPVYRNPVKKYTEVPKEDLMTTKQLEDFNSLSDTYKRKLLETSSEYRTMVEPKEVPIVGYTGFVKGQKAKNMYGKSFKDIASTSKGLR